MNGQVQQIGKRMGKAGKRGPELCPRGRLQQHGAKFGVTMPVSRKDAVVDLDGDLIALAHQLRQLMVVFGAVILRPASQHEAVVAQPFVRFFCSACPNQYVNVAQGPHGRLRIDCEGQRCSLQGHVRDSPFAEQLRHAAQNHPLFQAIDRLAAIQIVQACAYVGRWLDPVDLKIAP